MTRLYSGRGKLQGKGLLRAGAQVLTVATLAAMSGPLAAQAQDAAHLDTHSKQGGQAYGQGRYSKAISLLKRNLEARERTLGREHPFTLTTMESLALLYKAQGNYSEAEPLYKRALEARERALGWEHPTTLATASSLASLYKAQGRHGEAEPLYVRVLAASGRASGN
jgi:tetratricopeptide (TPR) repeat protein